MISVCVATYNGEKYIMEQMASIISELGSGDEIIVVDDCSTDSTADIILGYRDSRIKLIVNEINIGAIKAFEKAISAANGDIIFLADQDDVWVPGRVQVMVTALNGSDALIVSTNAASFGGVGANEYQKSVRKLFREDSSRHARNVLAIFSGHAPYFGCAMAFKKEFRNFILPIPGYVESHDLWMAICGNVMKANLHLEATTLNRRIHGANLSVVKRNMAPKIYSRWIFMVSLFHIAFRCFETKRHKS